MLDLAVGSLWRSFQGPPLLHGDRDTAVSASPVRQRLRRVPARANLRVRIDAAWDHDLVYRTPIDAEADEWLAAVGLAHLPTASQQ